MPLVIIVLCIIVLFTLGSACGSESKSEERKRTNARRERLLVDHYMKKGMTQEAAIAQARTVLVEENFVPCIPSDKFKQFSSAFDTFYKYEQFEGFWVQTSRELAIEILKLHSDDQDISDYELIVNHEAEIEKKTYEIFDNYGLTLKIDDQTRLLRDRVLIGKSFYHPKYGSCEVLGYELKDDGRYGGQYVVKLLETGEICKKIQLGDTSIMK